MCMFLSRSQMQKVFDNRRVVFHTPIMTVVFKLHPEFYRRDTDKGTDTDSVWQGHHGTGSWQSTWGSFWTEVLVRLWRSMRLVCSHGTLRWRLKGLCQTTRTGSLTLSLTPSLNRKKSMTKFLRHVTHRVTFLFLYFIFNIIFIFYLHIYICIFFLQPV